MTIIIRATILRRLAAVAVLLAATPAAAQDSSLYNRNLKATFDAFWDVDAEPWGHPNTRAGVRLRYHRATVLAALRNVYAPKVIELLGWTGASGVVEVGCGFGWFLEALEARGVTRTVGTETSAYIQLAKNLDEDLDLRSAVEATGLTFNLGDGLTLFTALRDGGGVRARRGADVLNESLGTLLSRRAVRDAIRLKGANTFDVFTFDLFSVLTDSEAVALSANMHAITGAQRVIHLVSTVGDILGNYHSVSEWKALLPNDVFIDISTFEMQ